MFSRCSDRILSRSNTSSVGLGGAAGAKPTVDAAAVTRSKHRNIEILSKDDTEAAFIGQRLFFTKKGGMANAIDVALGKGKIKNAAKSPKAMKLRDAIATTNTKSDVWMVVMIPDKDKTTMTQSGLAVDSMTVAVKLSASTFGSSPLPSEMLAVRAVKVTLGTAAASSSSVSSFSSSIQEASTKWPRSAPRRSRLLR